MRWVKLEGPSVRPLDWNLGSVRTFRIPLIEVVVINVMGTPAFHKAWYKFILLCTCEYNSTSPIAASVVSKGR